MLLINLWQVAMATFRIAVLRRLQLSARVIQLTAHLKEHRKDYASTRGLTKLLSRRKSLMEYLKKHNRCACLRSEDSN